MGNELVDFHCHLDLYPDFENLIDECENERIHTLAVTTTPKAWPRNYELIRSKNFVRCALGLHPQLVSERANELSLWKDYLHQTRYVGEVGLDAGPQFYKSFELQKTVFQEILECCAEAGDKILTVHSVRSAPTVLDMIERYLPKSKSKVVLHWFTGSLSNARKAIDLGCYFSINSDMLKDNRYHDLITTIPKDKILTETDGPFTLNGRTPNKPHNVLAASQLISRVLKMSENETREMIVNNLTNLEN